MRVARKIDGLKSLLMVAKYLHRFVFVLAFLGSAAAVATVEPGVRALERGHPSSALRSWLPLAREGDPKAQNNVGLMYERGLGVSQSYPEAMRWYRLAADQGLPEANHNLGLLYYSGFGADVNEREAFKRFRSAAKNELPEAMYMLGLMVYFGKAISSNPQTALQLFESAAKNGYAEAQYMMGYLLQSGDLGKPNPEAAFVWSKLAADKGIELAADLNYMTTLVLDDAEQVRAQQLTELCRVSNYTDCPK